MKAILAVSDGVCCCCGEPIQAGISKIAQGEIGGCWGEWVHASCLNAYNARSCTEYEQRKRELLIRYHQLTGYVYPLVSKERDPEALDILAETIKEIEANWALAERITVDNK